MARSNKGFKVGFGLRVLGLPGKEAAGGNGEEALSGGPRKLLKERCVTTHTSHSYSLLLTLTHSFSFLPTLTHSLTVTHSLTLAGDLSVGQFSNRRSLLWAPEFGRPVSSYSRVPGP